MQIEASKNEQKHPRRTAMATHIQNGDLDSTWIIATSNDTWKLAQSAAITTDGVAGISQAADITNDTIILNGDVTADNTLKAVELNGADTVLTIGAQSVISGQTMNVGIYAGASGFAMENNGKIIAELSGLYVGESAAVVVNSGHISANNGISSVGEALDVTNVGKISGHFAGISTVAEGAVIKNGDTGVIVADTYGIQLTDGGAGKVLNVGLIQADKAIADGSGEVEIFNLGTIEGTVLMGGGDDLFNGRFGVLQGKVLGGQGEDTYIVGGQPIKIIEKQDQGMDQVQSTVSYTLSDNLENLTLLGGKDRDGTGNAGSNSLHGNRGDNLLRGMGGEDVLSGGKGDDRLVGGAAADIFVFNTKDGHDVIADFQDGKDVIMSNRVTSDVDFDDLVANHLTVQGDDLLIRYGKDTLLIENIDKSDLDFADFFTGL